MITSELGSIGSPLSWKRMSQTPTSMRRFQFEMHQRKFQLKMGLLNLIQIPCHHVLSNEIALNLKYCIGIKHFFNINLGIGIIQKLFFLFVFSAYLPVFLLKFRSRELVGCGIKFCIQRVPTRHTFDGPRYPKNKKYLKNGMMTSSFHFFRYFLFLGQQGPTKVC